MQISLDGFNVTFSLDALLQSKKTKIKNEKKKYFLCIGLISYLHIP